MRFAKPPVGKKNQNSTANHKTQNQMKHRMNNRTSKILATSITGALLASVPAHADTFNGGGDGTSWEDPNNWAGGVVPLNNGSGNTTIDNDHQVVFDADSFAAVLAASNTQNNTEYRVARLLMGDTNNVAAQGTHSLTLDQGAGITVRVTNSNSAVIGGRPNTNSTLNIVSGTTNLEAGRIRVGQGAGGSGTINVTGGLLTAGRGGLELGATNGTGNGTLNIFGGSFTTRNDAEIFGGGTFHVAGSSAATIGIGSNGTADGRWVQSTGGTLRLGLDAGGTTTILIDQVDSGGGNATFELNSILDPYDLGGAVPNVWETVLEWEGTLTDNGLVLSTDALAAGWEKQVVGNELQVRLAIPEPSTALLGCLGLLGFGIRRRS